MTPLDGLIDALDSAGAYNAAAQAAPEAVLWCDEDREFAPLLSALRARMPNLLTLGEIDPAARTGPAVWLRAAAARALPDPTWPPGEPPVIYVPGVSRETLRDAEACPPPLTPLVWLGVAGAWFGHVNGKDWTLRGFLAADRGSLNLEVADDGATRAALAEAAPIVFARPLDELRGQRWNADSLHALAVVGNVSLGGSIEPIHNPVDVVELALAKGATYVLMPVACRKALADLSDEAATKVQILFYGDVADGLRKALAD